MGACLGRDRKTVTSSNGFSDHEVNNEENNSGNLGNSVVRRIIRSRSLPENEHENQPNNCDSNNFSSYGPSGNTTRSEHLETQTVREVITREKIDKLVLKTLSVIRHLVEK